MSFIIPKLAFYVVLCYDNIMSGVSPSRPNITAKMESLLSGLPSTETLEMELVFGHYGEIEAISTITPPNILLALHRARKARELAVSHRTFNVGAAAVAVALGKPRLQILTGVNIKPDEDSKLNVHAEQAALQKAIDRSYDRISVLAVVGDTQIDTQSGHPMHTLHPCGLCRDKLGDSKLVDPESTLIVSATPDLRTMEAYNLNQLRQYHRDPRSIKLARFELPDMDLLKPVDESVGNAPIKLVDTPEIMAEERLWDNTVGLFAVLWMNHHLARFSPHA